MQEAPGPNIPEWVKDAIFYQIFPERFAKGDPTLDPENVVSWDSEPTHYNYMGGDLEGIIDKFDYLVSLGINAIYLNPIFWASSNHKYNPYDYYKVDPMFGTMEKFIKLLDIAHNHEMKVVLDGVFNHCGRGFFSFYDIMENRQDSPYMNWFHIKDFPVDAYGKHKYEGFKNSRKLPKFNIKNPKIRKYLLDVARYWISIGSDGWRIDAADAIEDNDFWREFRQAVKNENPNAYIFGEIWQNGAAWLQGDQFDGNTNYGLRGALIDFFIKKSINAKRFVNLLEGLICGYPWSATLAMYNLLGSHDTPRILTIANDNIQKVKLAALFQFIFPGVPAIYYGDEIGLKGGDDPLNRRGMPWDTGRWNIELQSFFKKLIAIRKEIVALRRGNWQTIFAEDQTNTCAFLRRTSQDFVILIINNGDKETTINIPTDKFNLPKENTYVDKINNQRFYCQRHELVIPNFPPENGAILLPIGVE